MRYGYISHMEAKSLADVVNHGPLEGYRISARWGRIADPGYQAVPDVLLFSQAELGLTSAELNVLLNIAAHWWRPGDVVFPRPTTIANRMGVGERAVQRAISALITKGVIAKGRTENGGEKVDHGSGGIVLLRAE